LPSLHDIRIQMRRVQTRWARLLAAPDRRRRYRWAQHWSADHGSVSGSASAPGELAARGFSLCRLDDGAKDRLLVDWHALKAARPTAGAGQPAQRSTGKAFFEEVLSEADLRAFPAFLATALDEGVLASVLQTMGMVPHLESVDVLASTHTAATLTASQLWHYDVNDERIVKLFIYLEDCGPRNGPFTFIPADRSQQIAGAVGHYVDDELISTHVPRTQWQVVEGAAGTAFLIDTGRCYHFGSRCEATRYAYIATYSSGLKFMKRSRLWHDILGPRLGDLSPLQRKVCATDR
jgi:hypothetical protein